MKKVGHGEGIIISRSIRRALDADKQTKKRSHINKQLLINIHGIRQHLIVHAGSECIRMCAYVYVCEHEGAYIASLYFTIINSTEAWLTIWGLYCQISQAGISNCIPPNTVGCNYLSLHEVPACFWQPSPYLYSLTWRRGQFHLVNDFLSIAIQIWWNFFLL